MARVRTRGARLEVIARAFMELSQLRSNLQREMKQNPGAYHLHPQRARIGALRIA